MLFETLGDRIRESVDAARSLYYQLVLLVGPPRSGKTRSLLGVADKYRWPCVNLNLELTGRLLELTHRQRALRSSGLVAEIVADKASDVVLLDNIEVLFSTALSLDPLKVLQGLSRHRTVVAAWPGQLAGRRLLYAEPGHPEARSYDDPDAIVLSVEEPDGVGAAPHPQEPGGSHEVR